MLVACRLVSSHLYLSTFVIFRQTGYQLYSYRQKSQRILFRRLPSLREEIIAASSDKVRSLSYQYHHGRRQRNYHRRRRKELSQEGRQVDNALPVSAFRFFFCSLDSIIRFHNRLLLYDCALCDALVPSCRVLPIDNVSDGFMPECTSNLT
jgi:hypothetical protein